jgi:hypothetical protein
MAQSVQRGLTRERDFQQAKALLPSDIDIKWALGLSSEEVRNLPYLKPVFDGIESTAASLLDAIEVVSFLVEALTTALNVLSTIIGVAVDALEGVVLIVREILEQIQSLLTDTSINLMSHAPTEAKSRRKPSDLLYDIGMSYLDRQDANRPVATIGGYGVAIVAMSSLPNPDALIQRLDSIKKAFELSSDEFKRTVKASSTSSYKTRQYVVEGSSGLAPDWDYGYSLSSIPAIRDGILDPLNSWIKSVSGSRGFFVKVNSALNLANLKINRINQYSQLLLRAVSSVTTALALGDSNGVLVIAGHGTNEDFASAIINSPNHPDYPKTELSELNYGNYVPITAPSPQFADSGLFSGALVIHLQSSASDQSIALVKAVASAFTPKIQGETLSKKSFDQYLKSQEDPLNNKLAAISSGDGYKTAWSSRKDQA